MGANDVGQQAMNALYQHRLISTQQLHRLLTPHHTRAEYLRRQLHLLRDRGLAERVGRRAHGQTDLLWWLTEAGAAAVEATGLLPQRPYRMSPEAAAGPLQEHTLATVETGLAFVTHARALGHECGPLDWSPEIAHAYRDDQRPGEDLRLIPDAVLSYVHVADRQRTLLTFMVEVDRTQMTIARLAQKLHAYAAYQRYAPQPAAGRGSRAPRRTAAAPAWRSRYPAQAFPRILLVLTGAAPERLERRIADLCSLSAADPVLAAAGLRAGVTTLDQLRERGPFSRIFTPVLGGPEPVDVLMRPQPIAKAPAA
ncbi:replication-relaxation family protein [Streptomyces sasae]|uniref:replication-relaxation family protein n=1 Tax=Streptomyces sasae TaxID=1266772 RepID=UPI00292E87BD|nr:replication-relaxation family protein [Streptomyces sasae]